MPIRRVRGCLRSIGTGYTSLMLRFIRFLPRLRPTAWMLLVTHRNLVRTWFRSVRAEARHRPFEGMRWFRLFRSLLRVTGDSRLSNAPQLRALHVTESGVMADVDPTWKHAERVRRMFGGERRDRRSALGSAVPVAP